MYRDYENLVKGGKTTGSREENPGPDI